MGLILFYFLSALSLSFLCSILEAVLLSTPLSYISMRKNQGNKTAALLFEYKNNIDRPVGAILSLNTIAHTIGSVGVGAETVKIFGDQYLGIISLILTLLILVLSEIIPKTIGASYWRALAMPSTQIIRAMVFIVYPLVLLSELITKVFSPKNPQVSVSREEVSAMVEIGEHEGVFHQREGKIIKSCIRLSTVKAREIMTPELVVESADVNMTLGEFQQQNELHFSRIPVYDKSKEFIVGYVLKDVILEALSEDKTDAKLSEFVRPVLSFSEDTSVYDIWEKMLEKREHISVIVDEYACLRGVLSMEDVIETMIGVEIVDEQDVAEDMQILAREKSKKLSK